MEAAIAHIQANRRRVLPSEAASLQKQQLQQAQAASIASGAGGGAGAGAAAAAAAAVVDVSGKTAQALLELDRQFHIKEKAVYQREVVQLAQVLKRNESQLKLKDAVGNQQHTTPNPLAPLTLPSVPPLPPPSLRMDAHCFMLLQVPAALHMFWLGC